MLKSERRIPSPEKALNALSIHSLVHPLLLGV